MKLFGLFAAIFILASYSNAMELRSGTKVGATRLYSMIYESKEKEFELITGQAKRIKSSKGKRYFQCTVNIKKLQDLWKKYNGIFLDKTVNVTSDSEGNCPTVFVSMREEHSADFCNDPLILQFTQFARKPAFEKAMCRV